MPQVIAAAAPVGANAIKIGTLVKLVRVLMLGPVCVVLAMLAPRLREADEGARDGDGVRAKPARPPLQKLVPWFIVGFIALAAARSFRLIPEAFLAPMATAATLLTVISMSDRHAADGPHHHLPARGNVTTVLDCSALRQVDRNLASYSRSILSN